MRSALGILTLLGCVACTSPQPLPTSAPGAPGAPRAADGDDLARVVEARAAAHEPGREHDALARLVGEWTVSVETAAGDEVGAGRATVALLHGGRFVELALELELSGAPVRLTGFLGFDRTTDTYQALWLSDLGTGMTLLSGRGALAGDGLRLAGRSAETEGESRLRLEGDDRFVSESWGRGADGGPVLLRRSIYRRVTSSARTDAS